MNHICFNGRIIKEDEPVLLASNRGYRYGDGLFETMKVMEGKIQLAAYHFERLFSGMKLLEFSVPKLLNAVFRSFEAKNRVKEDRESRFCDGGQWSVAAARRRRRRPTISRRLDSTARGQLSFAWTAWKES